MKKSTAVMCLIALSACAEPEKHPSGCPIMYSDWGREYTRACIAAYEEELARARGATITKCSTDSLGDTTCITE